MSEDEQYDRICLLESQLRSAAGVLRSVKECYPKFMPTVVSGEIEDIEKALAPPLLPQTERNNEQV